MERHCLLMVILCLLFNAALAQRISHTYRDIPFSDILRELNNEQTVYTINFLYNDLEDFRISTTIDNKTLPEAIRQMIGFYPIRMIVDQEDHEIYLECVQKTNHHLTGLIVDEKDQPLALANVAALNPIDSTLLNGGVSNESGIFVIPVEHKKVLARITYIGYKTVWQMCNRENIGTIKMQPDTHIIGNVAVKGNVPLYRMSSGGVTVEVQHSILHDVGTADDLLSMLPLVQGHDGNYTVLSKGKPEIYINNKKAIESIDLKQLKSTDIKNIEIITTPGAKYNAEVNAVIRINTIRQQGDGLSVQALSDTYRNNKWNTYEDLTLKYRSDGFEAFANVGFQNVHQGVDLTGDIENKINGNTINIHQTAPIDNWITITSGKAGISYDFDKENSVGMSYGTQIMSYAAGDLHSLQTITKNGQLEGIVNQWRSVRQSDPPSHDINAYYVGKIGKLGIDLNASYVWRKIIIDHDATELSEQLEDRTITTHSQDKRRLLAGKLVLTYPLWKGMVNAGSEISRTNSYGTNINVEGIIPPTENEVKESNTAAFAEYEVQLGHWRLNAGLRFEHVSTDCSSFGVHQEEPSRTYNDFFPNLSTSWQKGKWGLQLSFSKRITRPLYNWLINTIQYDNRYMYESGNPLLQPSIRRSIDFSATYSWLNFMTGFTRENDFITHINRVYDEEKEIAITQHMNFDHQIRWYATLIVSPRLGFWQPTLRLHYYQQKFDAEAYGVLMKLDKPEFSVNLQNWFSFGETAKAMLQVDYTGSNHWGFMYRNSNFAVNARMQKAFLKGSLVAALYANDIFRTERNDYTTYCAIGKVVSNSYVYSQEIGFTLSYNFNVTRSKYKGTGAGNEEKGRL